MRTRRVPKKTWLETTFKTMGNLKVCSRIVVSFEAGFEATDALCLAVLFSRGLFSECQRSNRVRHSSLLSSDERAES